MKIPKEGDYIFMMDTILKRRVVHVKKGGYYISMVTGNKVKAEIVEKEMKK